MMNEPVVISSEKLNIQPVTLTDENLNEVAKQIVTNTAIKLQNVENRIKKAEKLTSQAEDIDTNVGFLGRLTGKAQKLNHQKFDLLIDVNTQHSELFREFADIQQEAIKLVTIQYQLSNGLITFFSSALKGQLEDANGKIIRLSDDGKNVVECIIQQAKQYAIEQQKNEKTREVVRQMGNEIASLNTRMENKDIADNKRDNEFQSFKQAKDNLDDEQDEKIKNNELAIQTLKQEKDNTDQKQDELILKLQKKANIAIAVAIIAILLTIAVLAWSFLK